MPTASNRHSIKQTEWTYGLMVHFSQALGVNCTYCHNSRSVGRRGSQSPAVRGRAWYGIRMVRNLNHSYLELASGRVPGVTGLGRPATLPSSTAATCHQGAYRPLLGAQHARTTTRRCRPLAQPQLGGMTAVEARSAGGSGAVRP